MNDEKIYDIGIVGVWGACNYGSVLTGWCLYRYLELQGYKTVFVDLYGMRKLGARIGKLERYIIDNCNVLEEGKNFKISADYNKICGTFIVGADQCFRAMSVDQFAYGQLLDWADKDCKKISYATSFAVWNYEGGVIERKLVKHYLKRFDHISVREKSGVKLCKNEFGIDAQMVLDPILLLDSEELMKLSGYTGTAEKKGILCYLLDVNENLRKVVDYASEKLNKPIRFVYGADGTGADEEKVLYGLEEFVKRFIEADYVVTDSYHGMCLAIAFQKPFNVVINKIRGEERFRSLIEMLGLNDRVCDIQSEDILINTSTEMNWDDIYSKLQDFKEYSSVWLANALGSFHVRRVENEESIYSAVDSLWEEKNNYIQWITSITNKLIFDREQRIKKYLVNVIKENDKIAVRGAGGHTVRLMPVLREVCDKCRSKIICIIDNGSVSEEWEIPVVKSDTFKDMRADKVIISSAIYRQEFLEEKYGDAEVIDIYKIFEGELEENQAYYETASILPEDNERIKTSYCSKAELASNLSSWKKKLNETGHMITAIKPIESKRYTYNEGLWVTVEKKNNIQNNELCTGCMACMNACPAHAIYESADQYGFYKAKIDETRCKDCGLCKSICPVLNGCTVEAPKKCYAVMGEDKYRRDASSGGVFPILAEKFIESGNAVYGAVMDSEWNVYHVEGSSREEVKIMGHSKYVQSRMGDIYESVRKNLAVGKQVLFVGCPCQIAGLYTSLTGKDVEGLYTIELLCHYVPSKMFFDKYVAENHMNASSYTFRVKDKGWTYDTFAVEYKDGKRIVGGYADDTYQKAFHNRFMMPYHCEFCAFSGKERVGDITVGDYHGIGEHDCSLDDKKGTSAVLVNTTKGEKLLEALQEKAKIFETPLEWILQNRIGGKFFAPLERDIFWSRIKDDSFNCTVGSLIQREEYL